MYPVEYLPRLIDPLLEHLLGHVSALLIVGPRGSGKTTTALRHARSVIRLDQEADALAFRADPDSALRGLPEPILLDEWQIVPGVLGAVKRSVDADPRHGRFIVTGSERAAAQDGWPGTGRLVRLPMSGITMREQAARSTGPSFMDRMTGGARLQAAEDSPDLRGYVELAVRGGFPAMLTESDEVARAMWLRSYVDHVLDRDAPLVDSSRDPRRMRRYLEAYALNTAGVVDDTTLYQAAGIDRRTAIAYERLLTDLHVVEALPAWTPNRLKRLVLSPKRHVVDPAIAAAVLDLTVDQVMRSGNLLGRMLESFVVAQLRPEVALGSPRPRLYHLRQRDGRSEVDVVAELGLGEVIGIEVKAAAGPGPDDARHLAGLRDELGSSFIGGVVLHTGRRTYQLGPSIVAAPISSIWSG